MQLELIELTIVGLVLLPLVILSILFLLDSQKSEGRGKKTSIYGFLTFIMMFTYLFVNWILPLFFTVDITFIVILFGSAFTFLPVWVVSFTKPDLMESMRIPLAIMFLVVWAVYVIPRLLLATSFATYFLAVVFAITIIFLLLRVKDDNKVILLILGLLLVYLERAWTLFDILIEFVVVTIGFWLVLIWYLLNRRSS